MLRRSRVEGARQQIETSETSVLVGSTRVGVARDERVALIQLIINARAESRARIGCQHRQIKWRDVQRRVENSRVDDGIVLNRAPLEIQEERSLLLNNRAADLDAVLTRLKRRAVRRKRIARVHALVVETE